MPGDATPICSACGATGLDFLTIANLRRTRCPYCHHSERLDFEPFNYAGFAMATRDETGAAPAVLADQAAALAPYVREGARALEVGCATGALAAELRRTLRFQRYDGVELSPARETAAAQCDQVFGQGLPELVEGAVVAAGSYEVLVSSHCLEHIADLDRWMAAVSHVLSADGILFIEVPNRSGHPRLPFDDNRSHLHFFSVQSLTRLLARHGFETVASRTGCFHDARGPDCLRVVARRYRPEPESAGKPLSDRLEGEGPVVIWGAGRIVDELYEHFFDAARIAFFVDRDPAKQGGTRMGRTVCSPDALAQSPGATVLVGSLEYEAEIRREIETKFSGLGLEVVTISSLLKVA